MIKIVARMKVAEGKVPEFLSLAGELVEKSRAEEGNVSYSLNRSNEDAQVFAFLECWKDQTAIDTHNGTDHFTGILPKLGALCAEAQPVELYTEIEC